MDNKERRIVLLGKTGSGKSSVGNTLLNGQFFTSSASAASETTGCTFNTLTRFGRKITVIDTPGIYDTNISNKEVLQEISKCIALSAPGPHAFLLVIHGLNRFTKEECDSIRKFAENFGEEIYKYMMIVFTRKDDLEKAGKSPEGYMAEAPQLLIETLIKCDFRYMWINNITSGAEKEVQVECLLSTIDKMCQKNGGSFYSNDAFKEAEKILLQREAEIEEEIQLKRLRELENNQRLLDLQTVENEYRKRELEEKLEEIKEINISFTQNEKHRKWQSRGAKHSLNRKKQKEERYSSIPDMLKDEISQIRNDLSKLKSSSQHLFESKEKRIQHNFRKLEDRLEHFDDSPRNIARREIQNGKSKFGQIILRGLIAVGKHLLIALAGMIFI